ncbi:MAG: methylenetetrahydrofolate reductase [NAD(P)H] [Chloroflexi bacterium]|nr:methylenetetrahydrofolate reductase [NAD(P)H] [Chloroflexota bacterium]
MRLAEFYTQNRKPVISFEIFPPKTDAAFESLKEALPELAALSPDFMTVTYGAFGSTRGRTLEIASLVKNRFGLSTACHLTCVGASRFELDQRIREIHHAGIRNVVALRGDPPKGHAAFVPAPDGFAHASELVAHIRWREAEEGWEASGIAVAGYPEKHVEAPDMRSDLVHLKEKVEAGADCVITQLFYDNEHYFRFVAAARQAGISVPIVPGLLPILSAKQIVRITSLCGVRLPPELQAELERAGDDIRQAEEIGVRQCCAQAVGLIQRGAPGIHFYVLNKSSHMVRIMKQIPRS